MTIFNENEKNLLNDIIKEHNIENKTDYVVNNKKANIIRREFDALIKIKNNFGHEKINMSKKQAPYMYKNYKSIFDKIIKEDFNIELFKELIDILGKIENKKIDLHEGSFIFGKKLKAAFVDNYIYKDFSNNLDKDLSNNLDKDLSNNLDKDLSNNLDKDLTYKKFKLLNIKNNN